MVIATQVDCPTETFRHIVALSIASSSMACSLARSHSPAELVSLQARPHRTLRGGLEKMEEERMCDDVSPPQRPLGHALRDHAHISRKLIPGVFVVSDFHPPAGPMFSNEGDHWKSQDSSCSNVTGLHIGHPPKKRRGHFWSDSGVVLERLSRGQCGRERCSSRVRTKVRAAPAPDFGPAVAHLHEAPFLERTPPPSAMRATPSGRLVAWSNSRPPMPSRVPVARPSPERGEGGGAGRGPRRPTGGCSQVLGRLTLQRWAGSQEGLVGKGISHGVCVGLQRPTAADIEHHRALPLMPLRL